MQLMENIQYSLIYMLYKTKYYKSGRGYIYRAHQLIALNLTLTLAIPFCLVMLTTFVLLEKSVTKAKLIAHRNTYRSRRKYLIPFSIFYFLVLIAFVLLAIE